MGYGVWGICEWGMEYRAWNIGYGKLGMGYGVLRYEMSEIFN